MKTWSAQAPSNIALIKYMGKTDSEQNRPTNPSLSLTLPHLQSWVELQVSDRGVDYWEPLSLKGFPQLELTEAAQTKFLRHLKFLKDMFVYDGHFVVRSNNAFPADCGLASSASSFAALTLCAVEALVELTAGRAGSPREFTRSQLADWSRKGSGSSCRSFFQPWALWSYHSVREVDFPYADLIHQVVVVSADKKAVSSSQAHQLVTTSLLFERRPSRAELRLDQLKEALQEQNWRQCFEVSWAEFWDMHALFATAREPFGYMQPGSIDVLQESQALWRKHKDGPIVTMDAGPNVHLIYRDDQKEMARELSRKLAERYRVIANDDPTTLKGAP